MWDVQRRITVCDEKNCFQEATIGCVLCGNDSCDHHAHIVNEKPIVGKRYVCDTCYSTCMLAYERTQQEALKQASTIDEPPVPGNTFTFYSVGKPINL